jgi:hypothetical protein
MTIKGARRTQYTIRVDITFNNSVALGNLSGPPWYIRYLGDDRHSRQAGLGIGSQLVFHYLVDDANDHCPNGPVFGCEELPC